MIIFVDIDGTICNNTQGKYEEAVPIRENIDRVNKLFDEGNTIVYWTARGSVTNLDWHDLTATQLKRWEAKHHDLKLGKPHYDLYIDDKSINALRYFKKEEKNND
tara:strand:+ start:2025 stop:2339 length:315 start_codon:yes stop_codon:yes gene_type:complete